MNGRNRSLQGVRAEATRAQGFLHQSQSLRNLFAVPEGAVLMLQQNQLSGRRGPRRAAGFLQQHQSQQPIDFRLRLEPGQQPSKSDRLASDLGSRYFRTRRSRIALVKDEIDDLKHRVQALRQLLRRRHLVWNRRLSNLCLGAYDALGECRWRHEKCAGDLFRGQAADFAKGERNLSLRSRAGWQQVKIRRRRSSSISSSPVSSFPPGASLTRDSMWATRSLCAPSKRARRRITSMALKRAVEISQGRGLSGIPV